jgi:hypothetical protein
LVSNFGVGSLGEPELLDHFLDAGFFKGPGHAERKTKHGGEPNIFADRELPVERVVLWNLKIKIREGLAPEKNPSTTQKTGCPYKIARTPRVKRKKLTYVSSASLQRMSVRLRAIDEDISAEATLDPPCEYIEKRRFTCA